VINRRELEYSVSGLMHPQYPKPDIIHLVERLHTPGALRLEDLEISGPVELLPGIVLEAAGAHTEGSMNVHVETADGLATICGDVIYDFNDQIIEPMRSFGPEEYQVTGNHGGSKRGEKGAIRKLMYSRARYLLPVHDKPAKIEGGRVVGRLDMAVPGPVTQSVPRRDWFPA
jgi:glyoxylase-like metal-dependent hydrolase (beta-lactamase superfamily II)